MRNLIVIFIFLLSTVSLCFAQNALTVNNNPGFVANGTTTFTDLQTAIDYASAGDAIYVVGTPYYEPGPISYGDIIINKQLHLIGDGYHTNPANGNEKVTFINQIDIIDGADGSIVEGIRINYINGKPSINSAINNVIIRNNLVTRFFIKINTTEVYRGWIIKNNIISQLYGASSGNTNLGNVQIIGNIISGYLKAIKSPDPIIAYNIFLGSSYSIWHISNATFTNNIFYTGSVSTCNNCSFYNNLVYDPYNQATLTFNYGDNIADNTNIENVDPDFTNATAGFSWENDYHLQAGSPALTAGPGGTEIGIYSAEGSPFPESYGPNNPKITELKIEDLLIEPGQQIQIRVKAEN